MKSTEKVQQSGMLDAHDPVFQDLYVYRRVQRGEAECAGSLETEQLRSAHGIERLRGGETRTILLSEVFPRSIYDQTMIVASASICTIDFYRQHDPHEKCLSGVISGEPSGT
jgi:hypothetical protein